MRATLKRRQPDGTMTAAVSRGRTARCSARLHAAQGLIVRPPFAPAAAPGDIVEIMEIDF